MESARGTLYVVATPIGNLEDITLRALRILRSVDVIACEDTRHTRKLLSHYEIEKPLVSYYEQNESRRARELVEELGRGKNIALVSDAGTPTVSDPGYRLISEAIATGIRVVPLPGPDALIAALSASAIPAATFCFHAFLPPRRGQRRRLLESLRARGETLVFYEAPHRITQSLEDIEAVFGPDRRVVLARELTKLHEEFIRGTVAEVRQKIAQQEARGEFTIIIAGGDDGDVTRAAGFAGSDSARLAARMRELIAQSADERQALKTLARELGVSRSEAYRLWQSAKSTKSSWGG